MSVKIIILRKVPVEQEKALAPMLLDMRALCNQRAGYISGETLLSADDATECLVISTWESIEDWNSWLACDERKTLQSNIDQLLGGETFYQVYYAA